MWTPTIDNCDSYLGERTGSYKYREVRYLAAGDAMWLKGVSNNDTVFDIGAGMTEFDYCLRTTYNFMGRYIPIDGGIDGTDLNSWTPLRRAEWFIALEILEHLSNYEELVIKMMAYADKGVIFSTPNPATTDVLGMDSTHVKAVDKDLMELLGFKVSEQMFYGGKFSNGLPDSLLGVWYK